MRFPSINKQSKRGITVPELAGGMNLRESPTHCNDNQLTELENMWYKDGALRTRPGMSLTGNLSAVGYDKEINFKQTNVLIGNYRLVYYSLTGSRNSETDASITETFGETSFWLQGADEIKVLPTLARSTVNFVCQKDGTIYAFVGVKNEIWKLDFKTENGNFALESESWELVNETDYYVPTVMTHCKTRHILKDGDAGEIENNGVLIEGYNILGSYYKMIYSTVNTAADVTDNKYQMAYGLIESTYADKYKGMYVTAKYTDKDGKVHNHSVQLQGVIKDYWVWETEAGDDGLIMGVCSRQVRFKDINTNYVRLLTKDDFVEDNLEITAPYISSDKSKIFNMTKSEWFGGASAGLAGGTRLFLCGNTVEKDKALVCWSGLNDPLYFPDNSNFYVGDTSCAVTGFGKQSNMLVIFKENETWYTQYQLNSDITAEKVITQNVVDLQASAVYFPLTLINPTIGCPYPETVQLCRNRLVWLGSGNNVYTLSSQNQYSERNIYCVSDMISRKLKSETDFKNTFSADWEGHYLLFVNNNVYVMYYESYGYTYIASHTKTEDAQKKIPWWYWNMGSETKKVRIGISLENQFYLVFYPEEPSGLITDFQIEQMSCDFNTDNGKPIKSTMQTKFFDFGAPNHFKNISSVGLSLGYNGGEEITATFLTDGGEEQTGIFLEDGAEERTAAFTGSVVLSPGIYSSVRFGIRLECEGSMIIDGLTVDYRILGKAR